MKALVLLLTLTPYMHSLGQNSSFGLGAIVKMEFNAYASNKQTESIVERYNTSMPGIGIGGYAYAQMNKRWFADIAISSTRARYEVNFQEGNAQLSSADIRLCAIDFGLNWIINPNSRGPKQYAFAGPQLLIRRWGEETFINRVLDNSYWPDTRLQVQTGLGCRLPAGDRHFIQLFSGIRFSGDKQVIYDTPINQWFIGSSIGFRITGKSRDRYQKCPTEF